METKRLILRPFVLNDFEDFSELIRDKMNSEYAIYDQPFPMDENSLKGMLGYFKDSDEFFAMELKAENKVIGFVSLNYVDHGTRNLGYCIHTAYQGNGLASEAIMEIKRYAKEELKLSKLISGTAEGNLPSVSLLQKAGFMMTDKTMASFSKDEKGDTIMFAACSFECQL